MRRLRITIIALTLLLATQVIYAFEGEMGYFGGITTGAPLPTVTELADPSAKQATRYTLPYKENIYLSGEAVTMEGTLEVRPGKMDLEKSSVGSYDETYSIKAEDATGANQLTRNITLTTRYVYNESIEQVIKTTELKRWTEIVVIDGQTYQLDSDRSSFSKSILEDYTPGVMYYKGDISYEAVYRNVTGGSEVTMNVYGPMYGYSQPFAKTEAQKRSITIDTGDNQYYIEETPTYTMNKDIRYSQNIPDAISFEGNYQEIIRGNGTLYYDIIIGHDELYSRDAKGYLNVESTPITQQLPAPSLTMLKGHPAEADVKKMYSLGIFTDEPTAFSPSAIVTRGEFIKMLTITFGLNPVEDSSSSSGFGFGFGNQATEEPNVFSDISKTSDLYPYARAAYDAGLISGGAVRPNAPLTREDLYVFSIRAMGLERLGIATGNVYTPFVDDALISTYAKSGVYAASKIGLIPAGTGYLYPQKQVTYAECAALLGSVIDYLRYDLQKDYNTYILTSPF